jgi:hypothetical protein
MTSDSASSLSGQNGMLQADAEYCYKGRKDGALESRLLDFLPKIRVPT